MRKVMKLGFLPAALLMAMCLSTVATAKTPQLRAITNTCIGENFDSVTAPALPPGWASTVTTGAATTTPWATRAVGYADTGKNAAYLDDYNDYADVSLYSKVYSVLAADTPYVTFRHSFVLWAPEAVSLQGAAYNGAVLEVSINSGPYTDLVSAGGSFIFGGYNASLDSTFDNPIDQPPSNRAVWSGDSAGFITTTAIVPASAVGGSIQFRWRLGTSGGSRSYDTHSGWWIDSLQTQALSDIGDLIFMDGFDGGTCIPQ